MYFSESVIYISLLLSLYHAGVGQSSVHLCMMCAVGSDNIAIMVSLFLFFIIHLFDSVFFSFCNIYLSGPFVCISPLLLHYYAGVGQSSVHLCIMCAVGYHGITLEGENTVGRSNKMQWWSHILHNTTDTLTLL